jgi:hypothetical protein
MSENIDERYWGSFSPELSEPPHGKIALTVDGAPQEYVADLDVLPHPDDPTLFSVTLIVSDLQSSHWATHLQIHIRVPGELLGRIGASRGCSSPPPPYVLHLPSTVFGLPFFPVQLG